MSVIKDIFTTLILALFIALPFIIILEQISNWRIISIYQRNINILTDLIAKQAEIQKDYSALLEKIIEKNQSATEAISKMMSNSNEVLVIRKEEEE